MPKRITKLTPEQEAAMDGHAQKWIRFGWNTGPVDWAAWEKGARSCYAYAGVPFPDRIVRVSSPLVGALAAPIAAYLIALKRSSTVDGAVDGKVEVRPMMYLALSYDHRAIDGKDAGTFLIKVKECIEDPKRLSLDF